MHGEIHIRKTITAELRGFTIKVTRVACLEIKLSDHSMRRRLHGAELGDKEHVHDGRRGEREMDRGAIRNGQVIHACDTLIGIDEKPLPVERDDLYLKLAFLRRDRFIGVKIM